MMLRENDGSLSKLAEAKPYLGFYLCIREDGSKIIAAPEDLEEEDA